MATIAYTPSQITGLFATLADIRGVYATNGARTGFGFYDNGSDPAYFVSDLALMNLLSDEGFFTGSNPKVFYTPEQAATLMTKLFSINAQDMYGIEYKLRTEGFTVGDFMLGMVQHSPGDSAAIIMGNLSAEGYVTGLQGILSPADPALFDSQCVDGRCMGSGCMAPTSFHLGQLDVYHNDTIGADSADTISVNYPFTAQLILYLSDVPADHDFNWGVPPQGGPHEHKDIYVKVDGATLTSPRYYVNSGSGQGTPVTESDVAVINLTAGVDHLIELHAAVGTYPNVVHHLVDLWGFVFKADC